MGFAFLFLGLSALANAQWDPEIIWERNGDAPTAHFGSRVFPLDDQNDDGFADWGVSSSGQNSDNYRTARFQFFHGGNPPAQQPYMTYLVEDNTYLNYGSSCGDLNGDSYVDWFIVRIYTAVVDSKFASVYWGGPTADTTADLTFWIQWDDGLSTIEPFFGSHGNDFNFNGDEFDDLGFAYNLGFSPNNSIFSMFYGGNPMNVTQDWIAHGFDGPPYIPAVIPQSFGDVNGDGFTDFVTSSLNPDNFHQNAHFYFGAAQPDTFPDMTLLEVSAGNSTLTADMNGDGRADLICPYWPGGQVYFGGNEMSATPNYSLNFGCGGGPHYVSNAGTSTMTDLRTWRFWTTHVADWPCTLAISGSIPIRSFHWKRALPLTT
ncbi:MAG: VCBS repeat-containing protein [bacterium]|nr:VCBS repeat-containing protein [bacterium]